MSRQAGWTTSRLVFRCLDARFWLMRFLPVRRRPTLALMHYLVGAKTPDFRRPQPHCREKLGSPVAAVGAGGGEVSGRPRLHRPLRSDGRHHDRGRRGDDLEVPRVGGIPPEGQRAGLQAGQARARGAWAHGLLLLAPAPACGTGTCLRSAPSPPSAPRAPFIPVNWDGAVPDLVVPQNAVVLARDHQVRPQDLESKPAGDLDGDVWRCKSWRSFDGRLLQGSLCAWRGFGPRKIGVTYWDVSGAVGHITYGTQWLWVFGNWRTGRHDGRERLLLRQPLGAGRSLAGAGPCGGQDAGD